MTVELTSRRNRSGGLDVGAAPIRARGRVFLVEHVDPSAHPLISTNDIAFDLRAILSIPLPLPWRVARKKVDGRDALQLEQVTGEVTGLVDGEGKPLLPSAYLEVPREDPERTRFEPVKAREDLARVAATIAGRYSRQR
jgi:UTP--glucose-1-phosphate uridylyltransferase